MRFFLLCVAVVATVKACDSDSDCRAGKEVCDDGACRRRHKCDGVTCGAHEKCERKSGTCKCAEGYAVNSHGHCKTDVCESHTCHEHARCTLHETRFGDFDQDCNCKPGRRGDGLTVCNKDFCGLDTHKCGAHATCKPLHANYGYDYECNCDAGYVGSGSRHADLKGSGYRSDCEPFNCDEKMIAPSDARYRVVHPEGADGLSWTAAQQLCREKGPYWDLVVIDNAQEHQKVLELTNCAHNGFWVGVYKEFPGDDFQTILKEPYDFMNKWKTGQPTSSEKELCVRMRIGQFNDASCRNSWTDKKTSGVGMGYICEKHNRRVEDGVKCEQADNDRVAPFKTALGCTKPKCLGRGNYNIVDAWKKPSGGAGLAHLYGFAVAITLPAEAHAKGASIMLRFADGNRMGNIQTYNLKFWGFYNDNNDVLFHTKYWNTDRDDRTTVLINVDNISSPDYPEVFYWSGRVTKHSCFQNGISRSSRAPIIMDAVVADFKPGLKDAETVRAVAFRGGVLKRVKT